MNTNDGGPAFPIVAMDAATGQPINGCFYSGMSLRDWLAGREQLTEYDEVELGAGMAEALAGRPSPSYAEPLTPTPEERLAMLRWNADWRAALKYMRADAMLRAREAGR